MNKRVDQLIYDKSLRPSKLGIVFADLNGLKTVNDSQGHEAGDRLLKKSALLLRTVFEGYEIYRAGGDEFLIICPDIDDVKLAQNISELRKMCENTSDVSFALGSGFFTGEYNISLAMQSADEEMYRDKKKYYLMHPEKKRRT